MWIGMEVNQNLLNFWLPTGPYPWDANLLLPIWRQTPKPRSHLASCPPVTSAVLTLKCFTWWVMSSINSLLLLLAPCSPGHQGKSNPPTQPRTWRTWPKVGCSAPRVHSDIIQGVPQGQELLNLWEVLRADRGIKSVKLCLAIQE